MNQEEQFVNSMKKMSPKEILKQHSEHEPTEVDLRLISEIMNKTHLNEGVMNILILYVLKKTNMKLPKQSMEKIAFHWAEKKITTVEEAMNQSRKEYRDYRKFNENNKIPGKTTTMDKYIILSCLRLIRTNKYVLTKINTPSNERDVIMLNNQQLELMISALLGVECDIDFSKKIDVYLEDKPFYYEDGKNVVDLDIDDFIQCLAI